MKGMNKPRAQHKKKKDSDVAEKLAEKKEQRRERKHEQKIIKRKSRRTGHVVTPPSDDKP